MKIETDRMYYEFMNYSHLVKNGVSIFKEFQNWHKFTNV